MSASAVIVLCLIWTVIHFVARSLSHHDGALLPTNTRNRAGRQRIKVQVEWVHLKIETASWNQYHDALIGQLSSKRYHAQQVALKLLYNVGVAVGIMGMLCATGILVWSCATMVGGLGQPRLSKRDLGSQQVGSTKPPLVQAIIPGVTAPFSHIIPMLSALFCSQLIHELGHAISSALEAIPMQSAGVALTLIIPSAFVAFPAGYIDTLKPLAKARVIAAGPWHNAVGWIILLVLGWLQLSYHLMTLLGYENISDVGRVVISVQSRTTLRDYLPPGSIITMVDDLRLSGDEETWTSYLTMPRTPMEMMGWCVPGPAFLDSPETCCVEDVSVSLLSCFTNGNEQGCVDAVPLLTKPKENIRCQADFECSGNSLCVRPDTVAHLFRLTVRFPDWKENDEEDVVLWHGPRKEVWQEVKIGILRPRINLLPLWLPSLVYLKMAMLSLFLFNLLPLPYLDGSQLLDALLDMIGHGHIAPDNYDIELGNDGADAGAAALHWRWKSTVRRIVRGGTLAAFTACILLASWNAV
ncbi:hypothetical protein BDZ89DRAFT_1056867 [Hymenopellis radicata]|nr:hypothetical protein BDZ89DRAFT_1056867 [Hymenopellis radicata]